MRIFIIMKNATILQRGPIQERTITELIYANKNADYVFEMDPRDFEEYFNSALNLNDKYIRIFE